MLHPSLKDSLQLVFCALCQQGSSTFPRSLSGRVIMFLTFLILMFLFASYSANIVALLGAPSSKIKTLEDFLDSRLRMGADDTVFNRFYFPVSIFPKISFTNFSFVLPAPNGNHSQSFVRTKNRQQGRHPKFHATR